MRARAVLVLESNIACGISARRVPSTGCARYACASSSDEMAYRLLLVDVARPASCGKMYHILMRTGQLVNW